MSRRRLSGRWFEQIAVGEAVEHAVTRTVTETDNVLFTCLTPAAAVHLDAESAVGAEFGRPLVNSMYTVVLVVGIAVPELTLGTTIANLGMGTWRAPPRLHRGHHLDGDRDHASAGVGAITFEHRCQRTALRRREPAPPAP